MGRQVRSRLALLTVAGVLATAAPAWSPAAAATQKWNSPARVDGSCPPAEDAADAAGPADFRRRAHHAAHPHRKPTRPTRVATFGNGLMARGRTEGATFHDRTIRMVAHTSVSGALPRVRLSNLYGGSPLTVGAVDLARQSATAGTAVDGTHRTVTFDGSSTVTIPAGQDVLSDPVPMDVDADQDLLVSVYLPESPAGADTWHQRALDTTWISTTGNHVTDDGTGNYPATSRQWFVLAGLDVASPTATGTLVAVGDSITDGVGSTPGANRRWPDDLARRLGASDGGATRGLVDAGIGSNRILTDAGTDGFNKSLISRFRHDVLSRPHVKDVILLEGINDIGDNIGPDGTGPLTATDLENGLLDVICQAHAAGVRITGGTILPFQGAKYYTTYGEQIREAVNRWILTSGAFDGVIDFDQAMRSSDNTLALDPAYDSGDHLHPNDAGYQAMADTVDLGAFLP
ncbi:SGNH/GDSL hydrolase family protein [Kitasatospora sp. NPDC096077]|uniref:SGNH/GDSL hydrolase family protein n=1 Tax=Kitasatospora sp. NPDC096077 TaxID=3155544 RepID=UPI00331C66CC